MDFISLFSGIGGFDLGLERAGMSCVAQVEIGKKQSQVLARHFPDAIRFGDVTNVGKHNLPTVELVCGGSPCQDVSMAGRRKGLAGERSKLFFEFTRILSELKPTWFFFENVDGLLTTNDGRDFATVLLHLGKCGYRCAWRVFDTQYFGIPQRRERVFIVGHLRDGSASEVLFERESMSGDFTPRKKEKQTTPAVLSPSIKSSAVSGTLGAANGRNRGLGNENEADFLVAAFYPSHYTRGFGATGLQQIAGTLQSQGHRSASSLHIATKQGVRLLTPLEYERLQGFPDQWTALDEKGNPLSDSIRREMLGNAVSVPVIEWIGKRIMALK